MCGAARRHETGPKPPGPLRAGRKTTARTGARTIEAASERRCCSMTTERHERQQQRGSRGRDVGGKRQRRRKRSRKPPRATGPVAGLRSAGVPSETVNVPRSTVNLLPRRTRHFLPSAPHGRKIHGLGFTVPAPNLGLPACSSHPPPPVFPTSPPSLPSTLVALLPVRCPRRRLQQHANCPPPDSTTPTTSADRVSAARDGRQRLMGGKHTSPFAYVHSTDHLSLPSSFATPRNAVRLPPSLCVTALRVDDTARIGLASTQGMPSPCSRHADCSPASFSSIWFKLCQRPFVHDHAKHGENPELRTLFYKLAELPIAVVFIFDGPERPETKRGTKVIDSEHWMIPHLKKMADGFGFKWHMVSPSRPHLIPLVALILSSSTGAR